MAWSFLASGLVGICIGFRYRVPALIAASIVVAAGFVLARAFGIVSVRNPLTNIVLLIAALQSGYLLGLAVSAAINRTDHG